MFNSSEEAMQYIGKQSIEMVDLKFVDLPGRWHHITIPASSVNELLFYKGIPFDSSSVPGFRGVSCGDMSLIPDVATGFIDPFTELATLSFICNICEADTRANISGDPRGVAIRAVKYLRDKLSAESLWLPELEFYLFDGVAYETGNEFAYFEFDSAEIDSAESGYYNHSNGGYHALPPADRYYDIRSEMVHNAEAMGVPIRYHHHEAGARGQQEIEIVPAPLLDGADAVMLVKYAVKMTAVRYGLVATFLPKPLYNESGNGMHFHQFLVKDDKSLFWDDSAEYAHLSDSALAYIAGILDHAPSLIGITNPSTNSYRRLVPGFEAPTKRFYGLANRCAAVRVPKYDDTPQLKRIEFRSPDGTCNPYLAIAAQLMAGLDGIKRKLDPTTMGFGPYDDNVNHWSQSKQKRLKNIPESLDAALDALRKDNDYLIEGNVFDIGTIERHIEHTSSIARDIAQHPTAREMELYFDM